MELNRIYMKYDHNPSTRFASNFKSLEAPSSSLTAVISTILIKEYINIRKRNPILLPRRLSNISTVFLLGLGWVHTHTTFVVENNTHLY